MALGGDAVGKEHSQVGAAQFVNTTIVFMQTGYDLDKQRYLPLYRLEWVPRPIFVTQLVSFHRRDIDDSDCTTRSPSCSCYHENQILFILSHSSTPCLIFHELWEWLVHQPTGPEPRVRRPKQCPGYHSA